MAKIINSTITLRLDSVKGRTLKQAASLLKKMLRESTHRQNAAIKANLTVDCTEYAQFSNTAARILTLPISRSKERIAWSRVDAMDQSEAYRILGAYQKRLILARFLRSTKWLASFDDCKKELGWVDYQLYKNTLRARKLPTVPRIKTAVIPLAKSDSQFTKLSHTNSEITLENFALWDQRVDLHFKIPAKLTHLHPNLSKITRPNIRLLDGEIVFDFVLQEKIVEETTVTSSTLGVDFGVNKPFAAARVYSDGRYSEELIPSIYTDRQSETADRLLDEIILVDKKNKRRATLGIENIDAVAQLFTLREKRKRVLVAQDWSVAADIIAHSLPGEQITIEQLNFNQGGSLGRKRFRSGQMSCKTEHVASRSGKNAKRVNAKDSSHECPDCTAEVNPDDDRVTSCACGWSEDRDYTSGVVMGKRGLRVRKIRVRKDRPTPKRPRDSVRKKPRIPFEEKAWAAFIGAVPSEATGVQSDSATSAVDVESSGFRRDLET